MTTEHRTEELKRILRIFGRGCLHAGPDSEGSPGRISGNPADCEECLEAAVKAICSAFPVSDVRIAALKEAAEECVLSGQDLAEGDWGPEGRDMAVMLEGRILGLIEKGGQ